MKAIDVLEKYWGYTSFRNMQESIVNAALEDRDVLAILPTGGGKSVCFQVPAMMKPGIALVNPDNEPSKSAKVICGGAICAIRAPQATAGSTAGYRSSQPLRQHSPAARESRSRDVRNG